MAKKRNGVDAGFFAAKNREGVTYIDVEIKYPFCFKSKSGRNYFRYLEDGRYEHICLESKSHCLLFGTFSNSITGLQNDNEFWFKSLWNLNIEITEEDFEIARTLLMEYYNQYLTGEKFIAWEVQKIIYLNKIKGVDRVETKETKKLEKKINKPGDIIVIHGEAPF